MAGAKPALLLVLIDEEENVWPLVPLVLQTTKCWRTHNMKRYLLDIKADDKPVLLERVLRVIRHRGFIVRLGGWHPKPAKSR